MGNLFFDKYYDHFSKEFFSNPPVFCVDENYMMRFNAPMENYEYKDNNLTVIYFKKGSGNLVSNKKKQLVNDNSFIITNPSDGWLYVNKEKKQIDVLSFVISKKLKKQFDLFHLRDCGSLLDNPFEVLCSSHFFIEKTLSAKYYPCGQILERIYHLSAKEDFQLFDADELTMSLLISLYKNQCRAYLAANKIVAKKQSTRVETLKRLLVAREYLHDNLNRKIALDELTSISCLSKFHLYDSFKTVFGKTPHQYANYIKLVEARNLLTKKVYSVSEIAIKLGFNDIYTFSKLFKKAYNSSPSNYYLK